MAKSFDEVYIHSATIVDPNSKWNGKKASILIEKGKISAIGNSVKPKGKVTEIKIKNLHVSPGWVDMLVNFGDPGYEHKENLESGLKAAAKGGFTAVVSSPDTLPVTDTRASIEYIKNRTKENVVEVYPAGAITKGMKGEEMAEMGDMNEGGAIAFTDHKNGILNARLFIKSLLYSKAFNGLIIHFPAESTIYNNGQMNEGIVSTRLGLKPIPEIGEELMVNRDIRLSEYTEQRLHFNMISSANSIQLIKNAKKNNAKVSCGVSSYHLLLSEEELEDFDTNYKVLPPLKDKSTINSLIKGLKDDTIDVIVSDHSPQNVELKECEFDMAAFGMINLETSFSVANTALGKHLTLETIVTKFCQNPRVILGLPVPNIEKGGLANLTFFNPEESWQLSRSNKKSASANSPFFGRTLKGKVYGIYNKGKLLMTE